MHISFSFCGMNRTVYTIIVNNAQSITAFFSIAILKLFFLTQNCIWLELIFEKWMHRMTRYTVPISEDSVPIAAVAAIAETTTRYEYAFAVATHTAAGGAVHISFFRLGHQSYQCKHMEIFGSLFFLPLVKTSPFLFSDCPSNQMQDIFYGLKREWLQRSILFLDQHDTNADWKR